MGSPPAPGSKNPVLKFRSVSNMVKAPAKTGKESNRRTAVTSKLQAKRLSRSQETAGLRILITVVIKFTAPRRDETPAKCNEKIAKSTEWLLCPSNELRGGYNVHPVPTPPSIRDDNRRKMREGGKNQNLILFKRGKAISAAPTSRGNIQLPKPPMSTGITKKKIITNAWAVTITLYRWGEPRTSPLLPSS